MQYRILIVDDDADNIESTQGLLERWGYAVESARSGEEALKLLKQSLSEFAVILLDHRMPGMNGTEAIHEIRKINTESVILMYSADPSREAVLSTWRAGAVEFIEKDANPEKLKAALSIVCKQYENSHRLFKVIDSPELASQSIIQSIGMIGRSQSMAEAALQVKRYQESKEAVLIVGESGTGKELIARALHKGASDNFFVIDCSKYSERSDLLDSELCGNEKGAFTGAVTSKIGILERAQGGTVFFDEFHRLTLEAQSKILRILESRTIRRVGGVEEKPVSFRPVVAAQPDIEERVRDGRFLLDLYHRVRVLKIEVPPLRTRPEDVAPLIAHFCQMYNQDTGEKKSFQPATVRALETYAWPGNIRELRNRVKQLLVDCNEASVTTRHLGSSLADVEALKDPKGTLLDFSEKQEREKRNFVVSTIKRAKTVKLAAKILDVAPTTLYSMAERFGFDMKKEKLESRN